MNVASRLSAVGTERLLFGLGAILSGALTMLVFYTGDDIRGLLFGAFALYLGGAATPAVRDSVPDYKRTGAFALSGVGIVAFLLGTQSALPMLFIIGGIGAFFNLF